MEKRTLIRSHTQIPVACSRFAASRPTAASNGILLNCSCAGACIELNQNIKQGSILMVKATATIGKGTPPAPPEGFRTLSLAEVKWLRPQDGRGAFNYVIGLKYLPTR
jgi:hypothetical protein